MAFRAETQPWIQHREVLKAPSVPNINKIVSRRINHIIEDVRLGVDIAREVVFTDADSIFEANIEARNHSRLTGAVTKIITFNSER